MNRGSRWWVPCLGAWALLVLAAARPAAAQEEEPSDSEQVEAVAGEAAEEPTEPPPQAEPEPPPGRAEPEADSRETLGWAVDGYLKNEVRYRSAKGDHDLDLFSHLAAEAVHRGERPLTVRVNGLLHWDAVNEQRPDELLFDTWDTFDHDLQARLYEAYVVLGKLFGGSGTLTGGRQFVDEGTYFQLDGIRVDVDLGEVRKELELTVFGGAPVRYGETSRDDAWIVGLVVRGALEGSRTRWRVEYYHVAESFDGINDRIIDPAQQTVRIPAESLDDDLVGLSIWHRATKQLRLFGRFSLLNGDANELNLRARWFTTDGKWTLLAEWYQLFERLQNVTNDLTPFVPLLGSYEPFWRIGLRATHRPDERWIQQIGVSFRQLEDDDDEGEFNHEYFHYYATATRLGLEDGRLDLSVTLNGYASSDSDTFAVGFHADYVLRKGVTASTGIDYSLWRYDWFRDTEDEDVYSYWIRVRWECGEKSTLTGSLSVDDDRFATYTTVSLRWVLRF